METNIQLVALIVGWVSECQQSLHRDASHTTVAFWPEQLCVAIAMATRLQRDLAGVESRLTRWPSAKTTNAENRICWRMENQQKQADWVESYAGGWTMCNKRKPLVINRIKEKHKCTKQCPAAIAEVANEADDNTAHGKKEYYETAEVSDALASYNRYDSDFMFRIQFSKMLRQALARWYAHGFHEANRRLPQIQIEENLVTVSRIENWKQLKYVNDSYVMLRGIQSGEHPFILTLDHSAGGTGRLTYRELHAQVRIHLKLENTCSLRLIPYRPWYAHVTKSYTVHPNVHECKALPVNDRQCKHDEVFATTLLYSYHSMQTERRLCHYSSIGQNDAAVECPPSPICCGPVAMTMIETLAVTPCGELQRGSTCSNDDDDDRDAMTYEIL